MITIDRFLEPDDLEHALRADVLHGLTCTPKVLPPKWFYDDRGSQLFDEITRLPEYYPTRCERAILEARAGDIAATTGAGTLVELGSGTSTKTRLLLDALRDHGTLQRFVPFDVSEATLLEAGHAIEAAYHGVDVHAVVGDFEHHLKLIPGANGEGPRVIAFLGGTIGNLVPDERARFLEELAAITEPGEWLLLGTDLVKDRDRLVAAYDDAAGVTAQFNLNVLQVINRHLGAGFEVGRFEHVAVWDETHEWIEMRLRSVGGQRVRIEALGLDVAFAGGEEMRTEISAKFRRRGVESELRAAGFEVVHWWTDPAGDFALSLSRRVRTGIHGDGRGSPPQTASRARRLLPEGMAAAEM